MKDILYIALTVWLWHVAPDDFGPFFNSTSRLNKEPVHESNCLVYPVCSFKLDALIDVGSVSSPLWLKACDLLGGK